MYQRNLTAAIETALQDTPVVLLHGPRQAGKSTLVQSIAADRELAYVTLDDATALSAAKSDPEGFIAGLKDGVVIDEVQRADELLLAIKSEVDRDRRPGRFLLTGSANILLLPKLSESLAGRMETLTLLPLSQCELHGSPRGIIDQLFADAFPDDGKKNGSDIVSAALAGGYPEAIERADFDRRQAWFGNYINAILQRDVRDLANIEGLSDMPRLLKLLATRSANLLNFADLSRSLGITQTTLKRYVTLLETTFLVRMLPAWSGNRGLRLIKSPKAHLVDTGLLAHLAGLTPERITDDRTLLGALLETFVVTEIDKQRGWSKIRIEMFHFRTATNREVDLVLEDPAGRIVGIEVKAGTTVRAKDFTGLHALRDAVGDDRFVRGIVLHTGAATTRFDGDTMLAAPVATLWQS